MNANLQDVNLSNVNLTGANLSDVKLNRSNLNNVNFNFADLSNVDLSETELKNVSFYGTCLQGVKLSEKIINIYPVGKCRGQLIYWIDRRYIQFWWTDENGLHYEQVYDIEEFILNIKSKIKDNQIKQLMEYLNYLSK